MANINLSINFNSKEVEDKLDKLRIKAEAAQKAADGFKKHFNITDGDLNGYKKSITELDKINKLLNQNANNANKFKTSLNHISSTLQNLGSVASSRLSGIDLFKAGAGVAIFDKMLGAVTHLIGSAFSKGKEFVAEAYHTAVDVNRNKIGIETRLENNPQKDAILSNLENTNKSLLYLGVSLKDSWETAKQMTLLFPEANAAFLHNTVQNVGIISTATGRSQEETSSALRLVFSQIANGSFALRTLKNLGFSENQIIKIGSDIEERKKGIGHQATRDELLNITNEVLFKNMHVMAEKMAMADPMQYFRAKINEAQYEFGQHLVKVFQTKEIQDVLFNLTDRFKAFLDSLTAEKITGFITGLVNGAAMFLNAVMSIAEFVGEHFPKSSQQIATENAIFDKAIKYDGGNTNLLTQDEFSKMLKGDISLNPNTPLHIKKNELAEQLEKAQDENAALLLQSKESKDLVTNQGIINNIQGYQKALLLGKGDEYFKTYAHSKGLPPEYEKLIKLAAQQLDLTFKLKTSNGQPIPHSSLQDNAKAGTIGEKGSFDVTNETSRVVGQRPLQITINIDKQVETINISGGIVGKDATDRIKDEIINALNDALMESESIIDY